MTNRTIWIASLLGLLATACGKPPAPPPLQPLPPPADCRVGPKLDVRRGTIQVSLAETVDPAHAPDPANDAEWLIFRQLYETLVTADCEGTIRPGLAAAWASADGGRTWIFTLRENARFWDGAPVTARDVRHAWLTSRRRAQAEGRLYPWTWIRAVDESDAGEQTVTVYLSAPLADPGLFTHPALAVFRAGEAPSSWPVGTGPYRVREDPPSEALVCENSIGGTLHFWVEPDADPRDLLATPTDLILTRDRLALDFVREHPNFGSTPLPWDRIYVIATGGTSAPRDLDAFREELANLVLASDARPAATPTFDGAPCDGYARPSTDAPVLRVAPPDDRLPFVRGRLYYAEGDEDAGRLAGRIVALAGFGADSSSTLSASLAALLDAPAGEEPLAQAIDPRELHAAVKRGEDAAFIVCLHRLLVDPCQVREAYLGPAYDPGAGGLVISLVATRSHLINRPGLSGVNVDWDGVPRFDGAGWGALP